jgi:gag-polypeptide of LTR copia-type
MSLMWQLNGLSYQNSKDMEDFVDSFASILDRLECMGAKIDEDLSAAMLLGSINGNFEKLTRDNVCSLLIEVARKAFEQASLYRADWTRDDRLRLL